VQYLPDEPAVAYEVTRTALEKYHVDFQLRPVDQLAEPIYMRGQAVATQMKLEVGGTSLEWSRSIVLDPRSAVMARLKAVTERAEEYRVRTQR
jgi:hypothetical protein